MKRFPISWARTFARAHKLKHVIIAVWDGEVSHIVTWGVSIEDCDQAAQGGDKIKRALGWPEDANAIPSRVKAQRARAAELEAREAWLESDEAFQALRFMNFQLGPLAHLFRATGDDIKPKIEDEQAFVLRWMLRLVRDHGADWRAAVSREIELRRERLKELRGGSA